MRQPKSMVPETVQVEMRQEKPHAINIWSVGKDENLYTAKYNPDTEATGLKSAGSSLLTDMSVL